MSNTTDLEAVDTAIIQAHRAVDRLRGWLALPFRSEDATKRKAELLPVLLEARRTISSAINALGHSEDAIRKEFDIKAILADPQINALIEQKGLSRWVGGNQESGEGGDV